MLTTPMPVVKLVHQLLAVAVQVPGIAAGARVSPNGSEPSKISAGYFADVIARVGVTAFHRAVGDGIEDLQARARSRRPRTYRW